MPHTSRKHRKKFTHPKRIQVIDEDGWTHVSNTRSVPSSSSTRRKMMTDGAADDDDDNDDNDPGAQTILNHDSRGSATYKLSPSEPPPKLTLPELRNQFTTHHDTWQSSQTWQQLKQALSKDIFNAANVQSQIDNIVCIGLGSPSGFVQGGWVDRRSVALYQLAALVSIITYLKEQRQHHQSAQSHTTEKEEIKIIAQDPVFNTLDIQLLSSLGITVVNTPEGFNAVTKTTFLFAPGAERRHLRLMLPSNPVMVFGGPLEEGPSLTARGIDDHDYSNTNEGDELADYVAWTRSVKIQEFELRPETFWRMRVYWRDNE